MAFDSYWSAPNSDGVVENVVYRFGSVGQVSKTIIDSLNSFCFFRNNFIVHCPCSIVVVLDLVVSSFCSMINIQPARTFPYAFSRSQVLEP